MTRSTTSRPTAPAMPYLIQQPPRARRVQTLLAALLGLLLIGGVTAGQRSAAQEATPDASAIEATVQRFYDVFNTGQFGALDEVLADEWVPYPATAGTGTVVENLQAFVVLFRAAFPDLLVQTEEFVVDGDRVAVRSTVTGTHEGDFLGVPATGRSVTTQFIDIHHLDDGQIVASYHVEDLLGVFFQLGAFPPVASP